jgi:hypothetical protein
MQILYSILSLFVLDTLLSSIKKARAWRILLDYDRLSECDGITNRPIVRLQSETPPPYMENALIYWRSGGICSTHIGNKAPCSSLSEEKKS